MHDAYFISPFQSISSSFIPIWWSYSSLSLNLLYYFLNIEISSKLKWKLKFHNLWNYLLDIQCITVEVELWNFAYSCLQQPNFSPVSSLLIVIPVSWFCHLLSLFFSPVFDFGLELLCVLKSRPCLGLVNYFGKLFLKESMPGPFCGHKQYELFSRFCDHFLWLVAN